MDPSRLLKTAESRAIRDRSQFFKRTSTSDTTLSLPLVCLIRRGGVDADGAEDDRVVAGGAALGGRAQYHLIAALTAQLLGLNVQRVDRLQKITMKLG